MPWSSVTAWAGCIPCGFRPTPTLGSLPGQMPSSSRLGSDTLCAGLSPRHVWTVRPCSEAHTLPQLYRVDAILPLLRATAQPYCVRASCASPAWRLQHAIAWEGKRKSRHNNRNESHILCLASSPKLSSCPLHRCSNTSYFVLPCHRGSGRMNWLTRNSSLLRITGSK